MALINSQTLAVQLELTRSAVPQLFGLPDSDFSMIEKRPVEIVSSRTARLPLKSNPGGNSGSANPDGGDLGRGSAPEYDFAQITPIYMKHAVEITKQVEYSTNSAKKSVLDVTKTSVIDGMKTFRRDIDTWLQTAGNGVMATTTSGLTGAVAPVFSNTPFGARLLRKNLTVSIYSSTLATKRGEATIDSKPVFGLGRTQSATIDANPGTAVDGDVFLPSGLTGASPVWLYGIPYHHNTAITGSWLGISRGLDYVVANGVNAGAPFSLPPFRLAINQIIQEMGSEDLGNLVWHCHDAGLAGYEEYGLSLSNIDRSGNNQGLPDLLYDMKKTPQIGGYPVRRSRHADPTRFDLMNLSTWGRVESKEIDFFDIDGRTVFELRGDSGGVAAAYIFYFICGMQFFVDNPKAISSVTNVTLPTSYTP